MTYLLDLGTNKVACLAAELSERGDVIAKAAAHAPCRGLHRSVVSDLEQTAEAIEDVIRRVRTSTGEHPSTIVVTVGGAHLESMNSQGFVPIYPRSRMITREDVLHVINHSRQILPAPDREQIHALPREFRVDGEKGIQKPIGLSGGRLEVVTHIITGAITHLQNIEKAVQMAGFKVDQIVAQPLASGLGVVTEEDRELGTVSVDIGGGSTSISVFQGGSLAYSAVVPVGGNLVTSDLSKLLKCSPEESERLKIAYGCALSSMADGKGSVEVLQIGQSQPRHLDRRVLAEIIESRMREIATLVRQQIERSGLNGVLPGGVILTGGGSLLPGAQELFESTLQHMQVRLGRPKISGPYAGHVNKPEWAGAVGTAKYVLQHEEDEISPASGIENWKLKIRTLKAIFSTKA
ncbi:MAG: cell division protein FtsA [Chthonomonas sp.]|nr:cell division protein FtsA [Chthonomonas sp.]